MFKIFKRNNNVEKMDQMVSNARQSADALEAYAKTLGVGNRNKIKAAEYVAKSSDPRLTSREQNEAVIVAARLSGVEETRIIHSIDELDARMLRNRK